MDPVVFAATALAGGLGAVLRWLVDVIVPARTKRTFPLGILIVNVSGSLALGLVVGAMGGSPVAYVIGTGLLGGYTTFSTVSAATALMLDEHRTRAAVMNAAGTLALSVAAAAIGLAVGSAF